MKTILVSILLLLSIPLFSQKVHRNKTPSGSSTFTTGTMRWSECNESGWFNPIKIDTNFQIVYNDTIEVIAQIIDLTPIDTFGTLSNPRYIKLLSVGSEKSHCREGNGVRLTGNIYHSHAYYLLSKGTKIPMNFKILSTNIDGKDVPAKIGYR